VLCPYVITEGDFKLRGSKEPRPTVATKKGLVNKDILPNVWQVLLGNTEPADATGVAILAVY
jgi:hypothetical protein